MIDHGAAPSTRPNKKTLALTLTAGAAGVALLAGGTTFALWTSEAKFDAGTVTNATLDAAVPDRDFTSWDPINGSDADALVPGASVKNTIPVNLTLSNGLKGTLSLEGITDGDDPVGPQLIDAGLEGTAYIVPDADKGDPIGQLDDDAVAIVDLTSGLAPDDAEAGPTAAITGTGEQETYDAVIVLTRQDPAASGTSGVPVHLDKLGFLLTQGVDES